MTDEILQQPARRLPVLEIAGRSYSYVWDNRGLLLPPLAVVFLIQYIVAVAGKLGEGDKDWTQSLSLLAVSIAGIIGLMTFAVGLHRTILLREVRQGIVFLRWDTHLRHYGWTWFKIFVLAIGCAITLAFGGGIVAGLMHFEAKWKAIAIGIAALAAVGALVVPRSVLALPAAALDQTGPIYQSWRITQGNWLRMIGVLVLATLPFLVLAVLLELPVLAATAMSKLVPNMAEALISLKYVLMGFSAALRAVSTAVLTVTLSLSYDALATRPESPE